MKFHIYDCGHFICWNISRTLFSTFTEDDFLPFQLDITMGWSRWKQWTSHWKCPAVAGHTGGRESISFKCRCAIEVRGKVRDLHLRQQVIEWDVSCFENRKTETKRWRKWEQRGGRSGLNMREFVLGTFKARAQKYKQLSPVCYFVFHMNVQKIALIFAS